jgi:hypothetical protein
MKCHMRVDLSRIGISWIKYQSDCSPNEEFRVYTSLILFPLPSSYFPEILLSQNPPCIHLCSSKTLLSLERGGDDHSKTWTEAESNTGARSINGLPDIWTVLHSVDFIARSDFELTLLSIERRT